MITVFHKEGRAQLDRRRIKALVREHGHRRLHADLLCVSHKRLEAGYQLNGFGLIDRSEMVHIIPDEQRIAAAQRKVLNDLIDLLYRRVVIKIVEVRCKIHTAQGLCGGMVNLF